jgi:hypothetical protein
MKSLSSLLLCVFVCCAHSQLMAQNSKTTPNNKVDEIPIVDPFARNVTRPTQYGAVPATRLKGDKKG